MFRIDSHLLKVLRDGGYSTSDIEEIKRRLNVESNYLTALHDEFAKAALNGLISSGMYDTKGNRQCALEAYELADAMLVARGKGGAQ